MCCCFFFFKQKTAYEMRISDWSSDVCSSDLDDDGAGTARGRHMEGARNDFRYAVDLVDFGNPFGLGAEYGAVVHFLESFALAHAAFDLANEQIGRASCRERVCQYV